MPLGFSATGLATVSFSFIQALVARLSENLLPENVDS